MAQAHVAYQFGFLAAGQSAGVFLHGFSLESFVAIDIHAYNITTYPAGWTAHPSVDVNARSVGQHIDNTLFHTIWVTNTSTLDTGGSIGPLGLFGVDVTVLSETLSR